MAGLLGDSLDDPKSMATWQLIGGLLSPGSFGQGLSRGMAGYQGTLANAQDMEAKQQAMDLQNLQLQIAQRNQALIGGVLSRFNGQQGDPQAQQFTAGQQALAANQAAGLPAGPLANGAQPQQMPAATQPASAGPGFPLSFGDVTALKVAGGPDLAAEWKIANEGLEQKPGSFYRDINGQMRYVADPTKGVVINPDGSLGVWKGAPEAQAAIAGATTRATEGAKARYTFVDGYDAATGRPIKIRTDIAAGDTTAPAYGAAPVPAAGASAPQRANNPGALMRNGQLMQFSTPEEGLAALDNNLKNYALRGVNTLAGVIGKWAPPNENDTAAYVADVSKRLSIAPDTKINLSDPVVRHAVSTAIMLHENGPAKLLGATAPAGASAATPAGSIATGPSATEAADQAALKQFKTDRLSKAHASNADVLAKLQDTVRNEAELQNRNIQLMPLLDKFQTGGFNPEGRVALGNALQTSGWVPDSLKGKVAEWASGMAGGDPTAGKVIENQLAAAGIKTMLDTLDKEGKPNRAIFEAVRAAQESVKSGNATLKQVFALQKQLYDWHYQQEQQMSDKMASPDYNPLTLQREFSQARNASLTAAQPVLAASSPAASAAPDFRAAAAAELERRRKMQPRNTTGAW
jgi:hypothetical protein